MPFLPEFNGFSYLELNGLQDAAQLGNLLKFNCSIQILDLRNNHILDSGEEGQKPWRFYLEGLELLELLLPAMMCQGAWCCSGLGEHCRLAS